MIRAALLLTLLLAPVAALADVASLVADRVFIRGDRELVAEGSVEVLFEDARLTASRIVYDREAETLSIEGPLTLTEAGGQSVILAERADLDATLERGIITGARLVFDRQLQLAAAELARVSGRYTRLSRVTASSCQVCVRGGTPLWEIRAREVIRDEQEQMLYFDEAQFRVAGVPVFYLPRLRMPDTRRERASGVLTPRIRTRSQLGTGLKLPYFIAIGDHADLTLTPYVSNSTRTLEAAFRQELRHGRLAFETAISRDDILPDDTRAYFFGEGSFDLPRGYKLAFDVELVSDEAYLFDYGYSEKDRLDSSISLSRTRDDQLFHTATTSFRTLRASEVPTERELPNELVELEFRQRIAENPRWGQLWAFADAASVSRPSDEIRVGRDISRLGVGLNWWNTGTLRNGMVLEAEAETAFDAYAVAQDSDFDNSPNRARYAASMALRWPHEKIGESGAHHLLEPIVQLAWAETDGDDTPNEDSTVVEFDEGNLFSLSRFPGTDRIEQGGRLNYGVSWTRFDPDGWSLGLTVGRVYRFSGPPQFGADTGLAGTSSDWLVSAHYTLADRLSISNRSLIDDNLDINSAETRFAWANDKLALAGTHLWRAAEPTAGLDGDISELKLDGGYQVNDLWRTSAEWRFDADSSQTTRAGFGIAYENECVRVGVSLSRRFTSSLNVEPATELDLSVALTGFGNNPARRVRNKCSG